MDKQTWKIILGKPPLNYDDHKLQYSSPDMLETATFPSKSAYCEFVKFWEDQIDCLKKQVKEYENRWAELYAGMEHIKSIKDENKKLKQTLKVLNGISRKRLAQV